MQISKLVGLKGIKASLNLRFAFYLVITLEMASSIQVPFAKCQVPVKPFCCHMAYHSAQVISIIGALRSPFLGWTTHPSQFMDNCGCPGVPLSSMTGLSWEQNFEPPLGSRDNKEDKWFGSSPRLLGQSHLEVGSTLTSLRTQVTLTRAPDISWSLYYAEF